MKKSVLSNNKMRQFFLFLFLTTLAICGVYYSHHFISYGYYKFCNGIALGTPPCNYALELMYLSSWAVKNYWIYLGTIVTSFFIYSINNVYSQLNDLTNKYNITQEQIKQSRLSNLSKID